MEDVCNLVLALGQLPWLQLIRSLTSKRARVNDRGVHLAGGSTAGGRGGSEAARRQAGAARSGLPLGGGTTFMGTWKAAAMEVYS